MSELKYYVEDPGLEQMTKGHPDDAGYDISCQEDMVVIQPHNRRLVSTGLHVGIPRGCVGIVKSRSGQAVTRGIEVGAGVIDCGYTGPVNVLLHNTTGTPVTFSRGERIAQLVVVRLFDGDPVRVDGLEDSARGEDGFGSTGLR